MTHIDHGKWKRYTPATVREDAPQNAMFAHRESDGQDWYEYVHPGTNFAAETVKIAADWRDGVSAYVVGPAVYDATMIFPANSIVFEIDDYTGSNPQADLGSKVYDPTTGAFSDVPPPPPPPPSKSETAILSALDAIMARLEKLENAKASQP